MDRISSPHEATSLSVHHPYFWSAVFQGFWVLFYLVIIAFVGRSLWFWRFSHCITQCQLSLHRTFIQHACQMEGLVYSIEAGRIEGT